MQFYISQARTLLNIWKKGSYPYRGYNYCVKHIQHAKHANAIGGVGYAPRKVLKNRHSEIEFGGISGLYYSYKCISFKYSYGFMNFCTLNNKLYNRLNLPEKHLECISTAIIMLYLG